jgi:hypothetical protein
MNSLSWLIYLAEAVPSFAGALGWVSFMAAAGFGVYALFGTIKASVEFEENSWFDKKKYLPPTWFVVAVLLSWAIESLIPSKQTIYLIAASEASEAVVTSDVGKQMLSDIQQILQHQLDQFKPKERQ